MTTIGGILSHPASYISFGTAMANPLNYIGGVKFNSDKDINHLQGKTILITGGNGGLGKETVLHLARHHPSKIFLAARSEEKAKEAIDSIKPEVPNEVEIIWLPLDLSSTSSIRQAATSFTEQSSRLDCLILNAGVMALPPGRTDLGHEIQFGTNHTGHFLLTKLLLPTLLQTAKEPDSDVRVITLASVGHKLAPSFKVFLDQDELFKRDPNIRYGASKASNILFAAELARRYPSLTSVSVHPGIIFTDLYSSMDRSSLLGKLVYQFFKVVGTDVPTGAHNELWAAAGAAKGELLNGAYYVPVGHRKWLNRYAKDEKRAKKLWDWTELELKKAEVVS